jgi:hypothetical protein
MSDLRTAGYNLLHVFNPFWTIAETLDRRSFISLPAASIVACSGLLAFLLNLRSLLAEVRLVRAASPARVAEEDAQWLALHTPHSEREPRSPWDE